MSKIIYTDTIKLYLGNACDATDEVNLNKQKINTIICLAEEVKITIYKIHMNVIYRSILMKYVI